MSMAPAKRPLVGIPCGVKSISGLPYHTVGEKYIEPLAQLSGVDVVLLPAIASLQQTAAMLARLDGVLLTGSVSNVDPEHYGGGAASDPSTLDPKRDDLSLPLIRLAVSEGVPLFAICRGHQELNVALGGTLNGNLVEQGGPVQHAEVADAPVEVRYGPIHGVTIQPGGLLESIVATPQFQVNSLHTQAIKDKAEALQIEALAPDGIIEAVSAPASPGFVLGVQWHPEWRAAENAVSCALFEAFGRAVLAYFKA